MGSDRGNAKSKNSGKRVKFKDEYGNSEHSSEGSQSSKDSESHSEVSNMVEETKRNDLKDNPEIIIIPENKNDVGIHEGANDESGSNEISGVSEGEIDGSEGDIEIEKRSSSSSSPGSSTDDQIEKRSSSSSSPGSSTDDQSQSDTKPTPGITSGSTSKSKISSLSTLIQSPAVQVMDRQEEKSDPNRIPSAVFASSKSVAHTEWSDASNDSLFSIKVESVSFTKDPYKQFAEHSKRGGFKTSTAVSPKVDKKGPRVHETKENVVSDVAKEPVMEQPNLPIVAWKPNVTNHYGENGAGDHPIDFPVKNKKKKKKKNCAWASCSCSACSWALCYCSNYSCALCYFWNCSRKRWSCYCCSDSEEENIVPEKEKAQQKQKHQEKPLASTLGSKSSSSNCCSWFHCSSEDEDNVPEKEKAHQEKPFASALKSKSACSNCCSWFHCSSEDETNVPEKEKEQHNQKHQDKPLTSALKSKSSCSNCFSWFPSWRSCCSSNCCQWPSCCSSNCFQWRSCCSCNCCQWRSCCSCNYCRRKCC